jgi:hypothetical protein
MEKSDFLLIFFAMIILLIIGVAIVYMIYNVVVTWRNYEFTLRFVLMVLQLNLIGL